MKLRVVLGVAPGLLVLAACGGSWPANMGLRTWAGMDTWSFAYATEQFGSQFGKKMPAKFDRVLRALNRRTIMSGGEEFTRWNILPESS